MAAETPEHLYLYCDFEQGLHALKEGKIEWQSPASLNEALSLDQDSEFSFNKDSFLKAAIKVASSLIFGREVPKGETPIIAAIRRWRDAQRFSTPEEAQPVLKELLGKMIDHRMSELDQLRADWSEFCKKLRILSFREKPDNLEAWFTQAENGAGVVLRLAVGEETSFPNTHAVEYSLERPEITSMKEQMACVYYNQKDKSRESFESKFLVKAPIYRTQKEWRSSRIENAFSSNDPLSWKEALSFESSDLKAIYFGPHTSDEAKEALSKALKTGWPNAKKHQVQFNKGKFSLSTELIENNAS